MRNLGCLRHLFWLLVRRSSDFKKKALREKCTPCLVGAVVLSFVCVSDIAKCPHR